MTECHQTSGQSILQHGISVHLYYLDLVNHLTKGTPLKFEWVIPDWVHNPWLTQNQLDLATIRNYQVFHDCGKPFCRTVDEGGKQHFPNHAGVSAKTWLAAGGSEQESKLMGMDMDLHTGEFGPFEFAQRPEAATLMLTALAEIHSNAVMFGGISSDSYKIKMKKLNKRAERTL